ncbi:MAG: permease prefix domain 1-containing protein [Oscillospiraceae bacterium]|nr:permease prefix domain 1-containing protein [Oscillospiraceae bacterium]
MEDKLRRYVEGLFEETAPTKKAVELREEMIQNLQDKYKDLIAEGKTPEAAYNIVVAGIGDVGALIKELEDNTMPDIEKYQEAQSKSAMLTAIAVMMYILSVLPLIMLSLFGNRNSATIGLPIMFVMVAVATGLLIYNSMSKPKYNKESDTMVEEFLEWQSETDERRTLRKAVSGMLWSIVVVVYIIVSFATHMWHITWVIFVLAGALESLINILFTLKKK